MSRTLALHGLFTFILLCAACGGSDERGAQAASGGAGGMISGAGSGGAPPGPGGGTGGGTGGAGGATVAVCGNGVVEFPEQCDDGNQVNDDGCTNLCEKTCETDDDCDDLDPCNGKEVCGDGVCTPGPGGMSDGEQCGDNASCYQGQCLEHECGNGIVQGDEECDDGNSDEFDGCTSLCMFTCVAGDPERDNCANDCDPLASCDEATHACVPGSPLPDGTLCNREQGYCLNGMCVPSVCGNGEKEPNEECDDGNTDDGDECTSVCTLSVCGNGIIDGNEQCDDGKTCINSDDEALDFTDCTADPAPCESANGTCAPANLDGCDFRCKVELTFRGSGMGMYDGPAPDYCVFKDSAKQGNAFSGMFPDPALIDTVNTYMKDMMASGEMGYLFHVMDVDDPVNIVPDPLVRTGMSVAIPDPAADWVNTTDKLDFPFLVYREFYDDQLQPLNSDNSKLIVENGRVVMESSIPGTMGFESPEGTFIMHQIVTHIEIDDPRSKLTPPPESVDWLLLPESVGGAATGEVTGTMCGALAAESFASMGLPQGNVMGLPLPLMEMFCLDQGLSGEFVSCGPDQDPLNGDCSSVLDLMQAGCSATDLFGNTTWYIAPLGEPDADVDGDGVNDGYSMVQKISGQRVKVVGFAEGEPPGRPITVP